MSWRLRSVRKRILLLAIVPVLFLVGIYTFYTSLAARDAINLARAGTLKVDTAAPAGNILTALNTERPAAMVYLAAPTPANQAALNAAMRRTAGAVATARVALTSPQTTNSASPGEQRAIGVLLAAAKTLPTLHAQITSRSITRPQALAAYSNIVGDDYQMIIQAIRQETNATVVDQALALIEAARSQEALGSEAALMAGDFAARRFPPADRHQVAQYAGARRTLYGVALADLDQPYRGYFTRYVTPQAQDALTALENRLIADPALRRLPPPVSPLAWQQAVGAVALSQSKASNAASTAIDNFASNAAWGTARALIITGGLGLLAVIISIAVAAFTGRSLVRELRELRESALDLASNKLPEVVDRLALGQAVDVSAEAPKLPASTEEVSQVRDAFETVQRTAIEAAVGQARLRQGMSEVFRNLARRSQSLLHRQLTLLDAMERRARDPQELEDLFRIDHLTTRMRRHAESLIILSGHTPARGWRNPVPLVDVLRAAVAEVEDYTRIKATSATRAALTGLVVGDVIHMIAELAENATMFSPPNTPVTIHGDTVGQGIAVEIEDRGLGLSEEQRIQINDMLQNPPPFDPSTSDQLGLFVAGQLAKRHNIKISVRPSPYGGTTAIVLIPRALVAPEGAHAKDPSLPAAASGVPRDQRRHAALAPGAADFGAGPLTLAPPAAVNPWGRTDIPAMREPSEPSGLATAGPGVSALDATGPGAATLETPVFGAAGLVTGRTGAAPDTGSHAGPDAGADPGAGSHAGPDAGHLPRRIRQASLAPQLRDNTIEPLGVPEAGDFLAPAPEHARSTMAAMQHGWERGRSVFDLTDRTPPGGTSLGAPDPGGTSTGAEGGAAQDAAAWGGAEPGGAGPAAECGTQAGFLPSPPGDDIWVTDIGAPGADTPGVGTAPAGDGGITHTERSDETRESGGAGG